MLTSDKNENKCIEDDTKAAARHLKKQK